MKKKILVIDDDATVRFLLEKLLEKEFEVVVKDDGYEALNWLNSGNIPDLILLDMEMPDINGNVIIRRVKFSPKHRNVPIIIISGNDNESIIKNFAKLGATDYILKPFKEDDLKKRINKAIVHE